MMRVYVTQGCLETCLIFASSKFRGQEGDGKAKIHEIKDEAVDGAVQGKAWRRTYLKQEPMTVGPLSFGELSTYT